MNRVGDDESELAQAVRVSLMAKGRAIHPRCGKVDSFVADGKHRSAVPTEHDSIVSPLPLFASIIVFQISAAVVRVIY